MRFPGFFDFLKGDNKTAEEYFALATEKIQKGLYNEAILSYNKAIENAIAFETICMFYFYTIRCRTFTGALGLLGCFNKLFKGFHFISSKLTYITSLVLT